MEKKREASESKIERIPPFHGEVTECSSKVSITPMQNIHNLKWLKERDRAHPNAHSRQSLYPSKLNTSTVYSDGNLVNPIVQTGERPSMRSMKRQCVSYSCLNSATSTPDVDVVEFDTYYRIYADLPSLTKDSLSVSIKDNGIYIEGNREFSYEGNKRIILSRRRSGKFTLYIPCLLQRFDTLHASATYQNGELCITLAKKTELKENKRAFSSNQGPSDIQIKTPIS